MGFISLKPLRAANLQEGEGVPLIFCHCFIMPFLGEGNSSLLIRSKAECLFNGGLYIDNILPSSRNCLELSIIAQH